MVVDAVARNSSQTPEQGQIQGKNEKSLQKSRGGALKPSIYAGFYEKISVKYNRAAVQKNRASQENNRTPWSVFAGPSGKVQSQPAGRSSCSQRPAKLCSR
jgi:hypothetical protein